MPLIASLLASALAVSAATGIAQLLPAGDFAGRDGRPGEGRKWRVDDARGRAIAAQMNATAARTPIVIDYDHQTLSVADNGAKAPAAGWIHRVEWRDGRGLYARVEWTAKAADHIDAGEYRYISPVILFDPQSLVVKSVAMASLVNFPNVLGMDAAITAALGAFRADSETSAPLALLSAEAEKLRAAFGLTVHQWSRAAQRPSRAAALGGHIADPRSAEAEKMRAAFGLTARQWSRAAERSSKAAALSGHIADPPSAEAEKMRAAFGLTAHQWSRAAERSSKAAALSARIVDPLLVEAEKLRGVIARAPG